jgi:hypothetical protein
VNAVAELERLEIWISAEGLALVLEEAKQTGRDPGAVLADCLMQRVAMRKAGEDVDLLLRERGCGDRLSVSLPRDRLDALLGLILTHRALQLPARTPARKAPGGRGAAGADAALA